MGSRYRNRRIPRPGCDRRHVLAAPHPRRVVPAAVRAVGRVHQTAALEHRGDQVGRLRHHGQRAPDQQAGSLGQGVSQRVVDVGICDEAGRRPAAEGRRELSAVPQLCEGRVPGGRLVRRQAPWTLQRTPGRGHLSLLEPRRAPLRRDRPRRQTGRQARHRGRTAGVPRQSADRTRQEREHHELRPHAAQPAPRGRERKW